MQLQRRLQANLEAHKGFMKGQIAVHKTSGRSHPGQKATKSTGSSCLVPQVEQEPHPTADKHGTQTRAGSSRGAEQGQDSLGERTAVAITRMPRRGVGADAATGHKASGGPAATAGATSTGREPAQGHGQGSGMANADDDPRNDPLMSMHDFGEVALDRLSVPDDQGGNCFSHLNMPMTMPEWGIAQTGIDDIEYGDFFEFPDPTPRLLDPPPSSRHSPPL